MIASTRNNRDKDYIVNAVSRTVSEVVADIVCERSETIFGLMGNGNAHFVSSLTARNAHFVSVRHESATVIASQSYHLASGRIATATTTYGAGFTNMLTSLAEARLARIPMVVVVGDAPTSGRRGQDIDQVRAAEALGVHTFVVDGRSAEIYTRMAFDIATRDRIPVIVALPYDLVDTAVQEHIGGPLPRSERYLRPEELENRSTLREEAVSGVASALQRAHRPLIIAGRGALLSKAGADLRGAGDCVGALFATSLMAYNIFESPWDLGIAGGFTPQKAAELISHADVVLVVGSSLNLYQMRYNTLLADAEEIYQVDVLDGPTHPRVTTYVRGDAAEFAEALLKTLDPDETKPTWRDQVLDEISDLKAEPQALAEFGSDGRLDPRVVMQELDSLLPLERTIVQDTGHFMGWAPRYWRSPDPQGMLLPGLALQSIGLGVGAAVGIGHARPERLPVLVTGDGGFAMALTELDTLIRTLQSGVIVVLNDSGYGMEVHQYGVRGLDTTAMMFDEMDFSAIARSMGAHGNKIRSLADLNEFRSWLDGPRVGIYVLDIAISLNVVADWLEASNRYYSQLAAASA